MDLKTGKKCLEKEEETQVETHSLTLEESELFEKVRKNSFHVGLESSSNEIIEFIKSRKEEPTFFTYHGKKFEIYKFLQQLLNHDRLKVRCEEIKERNKNKIPSDGYEVEEFQFQPYLDKELPINLADRMVSPFFDRKFDYFPQKDELSNHIRKDLLDFCKNENVTMREVFETFHLGICEPIGPYSRIDGINGKEGLFKILYPDSSECICEFKGNRKNGQGILIIPPTKSNINGLDRMGFRHLTPLRYSESPTSPISKIFLVAFSGTFKNDNPIGKFTYCTNMLTFSGEVLVRGEKREFRNCRILHSDGSQFIGDVKHESRKLKGDLIDSTQQVKLSGTFFIHRSRSTRMYSKDTEVIYLKNNKNKPRIEAPHLDLDSKNKIMMEEKVSKEQTFAKTTFLFKKKFEFSVWELESVIPTKEVLTRSPSIGGLTMTKESKSWDLFTGQLHHFSVDSSFMSHLIDGSLEEELRRVYRTYDSSEIKAEINLDNSDYHTSSDLLLSADLPMLRILIGELGESPNSESSWWGSGLSGYRTLLFQSVELNEVEIVKYLVTQERLIVHKGWKSDDSSLRNGEKIRGRMSPLQKAYRTKNYQMVRILYDRGANILDILNTEIPDLGGRRRRLEKRKKRLRKFRGIRIEDQFEEDEKLLFFDISRCDCKIPRKERKRLKKEGKLHYLDEEYYRKKDEVNRRINEKWVDTGQRDDERVKKKRKKKVEKLPVLIHEHTAIKKKRKNKRKVQTAMEEEKKIVEEIISSEEKESGSSEEEEEEGEDFIFEDEVYNPEEHKKHLDRMVKNQNLLDDWKNNWEVNNCKEEILKMCELMKRSKESVFWTVENHMLFPKYFRVIVWPLIQLDVPVEVLHWILSFVCVDDFFPFTRYKFGVDGYWSEEEEERENNMNNSYNGRRKKIKIEGKINEEKDSEDDSSGYVYLSVFG